MEFISTNLVQARRLGGEVVGVNLLRRARRIIMVWVTNGSVYSALVDDER